MQAGTPTEKFVSGPYRQKWRVSVCIRSVSHHVLRGESLSRISAVSIRRVRIYSVSSILRPAKKWRVSVCIESVSHHFGRGFEAGKKAASIGPYRVCITSFFEGTEGEPYHRCIVLYRTICNTPKKSSCIRDKKIPPPRACILHKCIMSISAYHCCLEVYRSVSAS